MRMVVLSFDDGTIYDRPFIELLNKYNLSATLNLNSGLDDFVWYYEDRDRIERLTLKDCVDLYKNHEVSSHTLTHPNLTELSEEEIIKEVNEDVKNLSQIFGYPIVSFAFPFSFYNEDIINIIKEKTPIKYLRYPNRSDSYLPIDQYHIHINCCYDDPEIYQKLENFSKNNLEDSLFVIAGHSYEFEVKKDWDKIEALLKYLSSNQNIKVLTMKDACTRLFK